MKNKLKLTLIGIVLASATTTTNVYAISINDDFNDGSLSSSWTSTLNNATSWDYSESGGQFTVTDITTSNSYDGSGGIWGTASIYQTFSSVSDFSASMSLSWDSESDNQAMQQVFLSLYDDSDALVAKVGYFDSWVRHTGDYLPMIGSDYLYPDYNTLAHSGSSLVELNRSGSSISAFWNGVEVFSGISDLEVSKLSIDFSHYDYSGVSGTSFYGTTSIDYVNFEGSPSSVSEPAVLSLILLGLASIALRSRKKATI